MIYFIAFLLCAGAAGLEALWAGPDPMGKLKVLRQPAWSPPNWAWVLIGLAWYGFCFTALIRLLPLWPAERLSILLLGGLMIANGAANLFQFRLARLDLTFLYGLPYAALLALFLVEVWPIDRLVFALFALYACYLPYAGAWGWRLWRLNPTAPAP